MKNLILLFIIPLFMSCNASKNLSEPSDASRLVSTIDFVQVLNGHEKETLFYYENNWKVLRVNAIRKKYIHSFQLLRTEDSEDAPFDFMLITTYANQTQYDLRETHFDELIKANGALKLLNEKEPKDFRKTLFGKDGVKHL